MIVTRTLVQFLLSAAITVLPVFAPTTWAQQNDLKQVASSLARDVNAADRHTITVTDFTDLQGNVTELGRFIADELGAQLVANSKSFAVVERIQMAAILKEHQISITGLIDPATVRKLGQFAGVDALVTGTIVPFADSVHLNAKVLDIATARVLAVSSADLPRTKAIDDLLSREITSSSRPTSSAGGPTAAAQSAPVTSVEQNDLLLAMKGCVRRGDRIVCTGVVTNKANRARRFGIHDGNGYTTAVDNNGNSYTSNEVFIGGGWAAELMPELPMNFYLSFPGNDTAATRINIVLAYMVDERSPYKALFRNLPLPQK